MKRRLLALLVGGLVAIGAGQAEAAPLGLTGSLRVSWGSLPPIEIPGSRTAVVNGSGGGGHLAALQLAGGTFATSVDRVLPIFAYLNLHFVPEPGTLVLLGSGIASLVWFGRTNRKRA